MLEFAFSTGLPAALLAVLFATLMWMRIDTEWSAVHPLHWASLGSLAPLAGILAMVVHWALPGAMPVEPALLAAVSTALTWWGLRLRLDARREQQRS
jgi:hypothetical protein